ncbi:MAG TPA: porin [Cyanothece sp. UBA12306]|nr:porin [Cyanothece sp. UBA12306]
MPKKKKKSISCLSLILIYTILGYALWWLINQTNFNINKLISNNQSIDEFGKIIQSIIAFVTQDYIDKNPKNTPIYEPKNSNNTQSKTLFDFPQSVAKGTTITLNGSTSMAHINQALKISFEKTFSESLIAINAQGSDIGIQDILKGKIDLAASSRPLTSSEKQQGLIAIPVTQDSIAIIVGNTNPLRRGLTQQQLIDIFQGKIDNWSTLGGENRTIKVINRPAISGTRQVFQKLVLNNSSFGNKPNFITLDRDSTTLILQALGNNGISYANYSQIANQLTVLTVPINGLTPEAKIYPYQQTLYYIYKQPINPAVKAFLGYTTSEQGQKIIKNAQLNHNQIKISQSSNQQSLKQDQQSIKVDRNSKLSNQVNQLTPWEKKVIRGIYLSRYQITNNASEQTIRQRVRYYKSRGINTIKN